MRLRPSHRTTSLCPAIGAGLLPLGAQAASSPIIAKDIVDRLHLQQTMPGPPVAVEQTQSWQFNLPLDDILIALGVVAVAAGLAFVLWTVRDRLPVLGRRRLQAEPVPADLAQSVENMVASQLEADELAGRGQLTEAMHTLLLRSLVEMRKTLGIGIPDSLTSREIVARVSLPDAGRQALADMVHRVELVYFGDRPADASNYAACRQSYVSLLGAMRTGLANAMRP